MTKLYKVGDRIYVKNLDFRDANKQVTATILNIEDDNMTIGLDIPSPYNVITLSRKGVKQMVELIEEKKDEQEN
jgi:sRNA-binding carbon storage regulator CsrA